MDKKKKNRISEIKILFLMLFLFLFLGGCFALNLRLRSEEAQNDLKSGETAFEKISFYIDNRGQALMIKPYKDITVNPSEYCVFLPSCAKNSEIYVYYEMRHRLVLSDSEGFRAELKNGDRLPEVEMKKEYDMVFTAPDGSLMDHTKVSFYNSDNTASVFIDTISGSMEYLDSDKENIETGKILIIDGDGNTEYKGKLEEIKGHGNSTWQRAKKPYGFKLYKEINLFNMGYSMDWVLLSNSMDLSMIRNSLISDISQELGFPGSPKMHYADLYLNGKYNGLYGISTKAEIGKDRLDITNLDILNKLANIFPPAGDESVEEKGEGSSLRAGMKLEVLPDDITGGYLVEHDYGYKFEAEPSRFRTGSGDRYVLRSPAYAAIEEVEYIADLFEELERRVDGGEDLSDLIDMESFARIYVLDEFTRNEGAGVTSAYYYKDRDEADPLIYAGPVWDYDQCLGNTYFPVVNEPESLDFCTDHVQSTLLFYDLYQKYPEFRKRAMRYYKEEFRPCIEEFRRAGFEGYLKMVLSNNDMNNRRWGNNDEAVTASAVQAWEFLDERMRFLDRVWINGEKIHIVRFDTGNADRVLHMGIPHGDTIHSFPGVNAEPEDLTDDTSGGNLKEEPDGMQEEASDETVNSGTVWLDSETGRVVDGSTKILKDMVLKKSS